MKKTAVQLLIQDIDKAIDDCDQRKELCFMGLNRKKYDNMKDGLYFARGAAQNILQTERQQIIDAANDVLAQNDPSYIGAPDLGEEYYNDIYGQPKI